jgi:hypothetical protein
MTHSYVRVGKHFGEKPNPRKEAEIKAAIREMFIRRCPVCNP